MRRRDVEQWRTDRLRAICVTKAVRASRGQRVEINLDQYRAGGP